MRKLGLRACFIAAFAALGSGLVSCSEAGGHSVTTPVGNLVIVKAETADRFPPGCGDLGPLCNRAKDGFRVLTVWLGTEGDHSVVADYLMSLPGIYVLSADGNRTDQFAGGFNEAGLFIAFTPPEQDSGFVLHWGDNAPITLGQ